MKTATRLILVGSLACLAPASLSITAAADPTAANSVSSQQAYQLAAQALSAEAEGDFVARQRLLREAELLDANCELARSMKNELRYESDWVSAKQFVDKLATDPLLAEYERQRGQGEMNADQHFALGQWCIQNKLMLQAYGHLNRALQIDRNHTPALRALGYQQMGSEWISPAQLRLAQAQAEETRASIAKFSDQLREIQELLASPRPAKRDEGVKKLKELTDPAAIAAVDAMLSNSSSEVAKLVVDWMASVDAVRSSQILSRFALLHPDAAIRQQATAALKPRSMHDYVPQLISMTMSPVAAMLVPVFQRDGSLAGYRQAFSQESAKQSNLVVVDSTYERFNVVVNRPAAGASDTMIRGSRTAPITALLERSVTQAAANEANTRQAMAQRDNAAIVVRNTRIAELLSSVTDQEIPATATGIWQWWDKYNEADTQNSKSTGVSRQAISRAVPRYQEALYARPTDYQAPPPPTPEQLAARQSLRELWASGMLPRGECLVAGTPVMTIRGLRPIEGVRTGDLVLTRDIQSGSLAWKPVIDDTQRAPESIREIRLSMQTIRCTGGHLFWVSGKGWTKASQLQAGDVLHAAEEPTVVAEVKTLPAEATFNLAVADNANYFVGPEMVLTHDVTERESTGVKVPGLNDVAATP